MRLRTAFALFAFSANSLAQTETESAARVLEKMEQTYAQLRSYHDSSSAAFKNPEGTDGARVEFKIWFSRPRFFRIDATTRSASDAQPLREVMWFDGESARMWSTKSAVIMRKDIKLAGSKMFGTYAYHVPTLLEASFAGPMRLHQLTDANIAGEEAIDGVDCVHVTGKWQNDPYEVWIGQEDHLVRKIVANYSGYLMEENHREIVVNEPMEMSVFHFAPENEVPQKSARTPPPKLPGEHRRP